jgi:hypothetical protein
MLCIFTTHILKTTAVDDDANNNNSNNNDNDNDISTEIKRIWLLERDEKY